jgi:hypothetical protein
VTARQSELRLSTEAPAPERGQGVDAERFARGELFVACQDFDAPAPAEIQRYFEDEGDDQPLARPAMRYLVDTHGWSSNALGTLRRSLRRKRGGFGRKRSVLSSGERQRIRCGERNLEQQAMMHRRRRQIHLAHENLDLRGVA